MSMTAEEKTSTGSEEQNHKQLVTELNRSSFIFDYVNQRNDSNLCKYLV